VKKAVKLEIQKPPTRLHRTGGNVKTDP
jgi:hypothetical protein